VECTGSLLRLVEASDEIPDALAGLAHSVVVKQLLTADPVRHAAHDTAELRALLDAMGQALGGGFAAWNSAGVLTLANDELSELFMLPPYAAQAGLTLEEFFVLGCESGALEESGFEAMLAQTAAMFKRGEAVSFIERLSQGRMVNVSYRPLMCGGWLATYENITERERALSRFAFQAGHDGLTKLVNRSLFQECVRDAVARGSIFAVLCLDLDRFKAVNDDMGHAAGDVLLLAVAGRLKNCHRQNDVVARLGGDEFAVMLSSAASREQVSESAERIAEALSRQFDVEGQMISISASVGIAFSQQDGHDAETLMRNADLALYAAKDGGKGGHCFFDPEMEVRLRARTEMERDLRSAIANDEIEMFYQPIVQCSTGSVSGYEALMRWRHPVRGMVSPLQFIPIAEACGLIASLGAHTLKLACRDAATWPTYLRVAVNVSPAQLRLGDLMGDVQAALAISGLTPARLDLEVTESILIQDDDSVNTVLRALRSLGVRIAMDDFGTGYSSLSYLQKFPFDTIKIDKSFIDGIGKWPAADAIVRAVISIAASLGIETVAEGVETAAQYKLVAEMGCNHVQGYVFSRPQPAAKVGRITSVIDGGMWRSCIEIMTPGLQTTKAVSHLRALPAPTLSVDHSKMS
jgi:diguanylate cyclase (GGDEF)-like protein